MMLNMVFSVGEALMLTSEKTKNLSLTDEKVNEIVNDTLPQMYGALEGKDPVGLGTAISLIGQAIREVVVLIFTNSKESEQRLGELRSSFTKTMFVLAKRNFLSNPNDKEAELVELTYVSLFNDVMKRTAQTKGSGDDRTQATVEGLLIGNLNNLLTRDLSVAKSVSEHVKAMQLCADAPIARFTIE